MVFRTKRLIASAAFALAFLVASSAFAQVSPAVATMAVAPVAPISSITYQVHVPPLPASCCSDAYEFHLGFASPNNSTFVKSTISYGCQVAKFKACFPPFEDRYVFYVSVINSLTRQRVQLPPNGFLLTPDSDYNVSLSIGQCFLSKQLRFSISNGSSTFSSSVCGLPRGQTFSQLVAGTLEMHNVTDCSQLPAQGNFTQSAIAVNGQPESANFSTVQTAPTIDCGYSVSFGNQTATIHWSP